MTDIINFALKMEKDGEELYRELAEKTSDKGIKKILTGLAEDEVKHYNCIKKLETAKGYKFTETDVLKNAKNIFEDISNTNKKIDIEQSQKDLYKKALNIEKKSRQFYKDKAAETTGQQKKLLLKLVKEEKKHYRLIESILKLINRPDRWLEDAEWYHLDKY